MKLSPGLQLVWNLAAQEAMAASMAAIEPEHMLCGLLKYVELTDGDLEKVAAQPITATLLLAEREELKKLVTDRSIDSTQVRRRLRQEVGQGKSQPKDGVMHRSPAARKLFDQAGRRAAEDLGVIESTHLLSAILEAPTPAMVKVMGKSKLGVAAAAGDENEPILQDRHTRPLPAAETPPPDQSQAREKVLAKALEASKDWLLLICEPDTAPSTLLARAARDGAGTEEIVMLDPHSFAVTPPDNKPVSDILNDLLAELTGEGKPWLLVDATATAGASFLPPTLEVVRSLPPDVHPNLILAASVDDFEEQIEPDPELDRLFRPIWLHRLEDDWSPTEL